MQDPLLQRRLNASFRRAWQNTESQFTNYVPKIPYVSSVNGQLLFTDPIFQESWSESYFLSLALGELPRLRNDANGYGPAGRNFIDAVTIPLQVEESYAQLLQQYGSPGVR